MVLNAARAAAKAAERHIVRYNIVRRWQYGNELRRRWKQMPNSSIKKQIDSHTPMVIVLLDGEEIEGTIEWYDRGALKVNRKDAPNLLLLKRNIKYMFKADERVEEVAS